MRSNGTEKAKAHDPHEARRVLVRKDLLTNEEVLEEVKAVRKELEGKRGGTVQGC